LINFVGLDTILRLRRKIPVDRAHKPQELKGSVMILKQTDPVAAKLIDAIHHGNLEALQQLFAEHPGVAQARIEGRKGGSSPLLLMAADWPGFFPNGPAVVKALIAAGADPNGAAEVGSLSETPLHYAASSDDVEVAEALIAGGADIEVRGGSIAGGTPLENAIGYGCWRVARALLGHGAKVEKLWHAAALGMTDRVAAFFAGPNAPSQDEIDGAFWQACHGGYRRTAEYLLLRGADLNWIPDYAKQTPLEIASSGGLDTGRQALVTWLRDKGAKLGS
jgi:ankyrin repeat protein